MSRLEARQKRAIAGLHDSCGRNAHDQSLFDLNVKYADVVGTEDVLGYLSGVAAGEAARANVAPGA